LNAHSFIEFVNKFVDSLPADRSYVFVFDNSPAHRARMTIQFLYSLGERFAIEFLPTYSPELNAIETCWRITRHDVTDSNIFREIEDLKDGIGTYLDNNIFSLNQSNYLVR